MTWYENIGHLQKIYQMRLRNSKPTQQRWSLSYRAGTGRHTLGIARYFICLSETCSSRFSLPTLILKDFILQPLDGRSLLNDWWVVWANKCQNGKIW
jgi:hypothetical protein